MNETEVVRTLAELIKVSHAIQKQALQWHDIAIKESRSAHRKTVKKAWDGHLLRGAQKAVASKETPPKLRRGASKAIPKLKRQAARPPKKASMSKKAQLPPGMMPGGTLSRTLRRLPRPGLMPGPGMVPPPPGIAPGANLGVPPIPPAPVGMPGGVLPSLLRSPLGRGAPGAPSMGVSPEALRGLLQ